MKLILALTALLGLVVAIFGLRDPICGQEFAKTENENGESCRARIPSYSYDQSKNECIEFNYGGCFGNDNRFDNKEDCEEKCKE